MSVIFGVSGKAGSGKDTVADMLVTHHGFKKIALADAMKRFLREVFDFSDEQLWGPSEARNAPDFRYCKSEHQALQSLTAMTPSSKFQHYRRHLPTPPDEISVVSPAELGADYLTPRHALQALGTEWGRELYPWIWVDQLIRTAFTLLREPSTMDYSAKEGLVQRRPAAPIEGIVVSDIRFANEMSAISEIDGRLIRVVRPTAGLGGAAGQHTSEVEQDGIPDTAFDTVLLNDGSLASLEEKVAYMVYELAPSVKREPEKRFIDPRQSLRSNLEKK